MNPRPNPSIEPADESALRVLSSAAHVERQAPPSALRAMSALGIEDFRASDLDTLVRMWRESFEYGLGITDPNPLEDQVAYFEREVRPRNRVRLAKEGGRIVGFVASNAESVAQLHVRVGHHRRGIGRHLLELAKSDSVGTLWLFTFARNTGACAFYESQGFQVVQRGFEPTWQLEDVKYAWADETRNYFGLVR